MSHPATELEVTAKTFRTDMWSNVDPEAAVEGGIAERRFGPVQVNVFEALPDFPPLNNVLGAADPGAVERGHLAAAVDWADGFDVDYRVSVAQNFPGTAAAEKWLSGHGFEQNRGVVKYVRDTSPPSFPGVRGAKVWEIGDDEGLAAETMVFSAAPALGLPGDAWDLLCLLPVLQRWRSFTVEMEESIVAFGSMLVHDGVAELGLDATIAGARGRGCNQALLRERILVAAEAGCEVIFTEIFEGFREGVAAAGRNLLRAGFVPAWRSVNWQRPRL